MCKHCHVQKGPKDHRGRLVLVIKWKYQHPNNSSSHAEEEGALEAPPLSEELLGEGVMLHTHARENSPN